VFTATRTSSVRPFPLSFQGDSPTPETEFIRAFTRHHHLCKIGIQSGTDFFEPDRVRSQLSLGTNGMELQTLQNTNQPVHVQIPEANLCECIRFVHLCTILRRRGAALWVSSFNNRFRRMFRMLVRHTSSGTAQCLAATDKHRCRF